MNSRNYAGQENIAYNFQQKDLQFKTQKRIEVLPGVAKNENEEDIFLTRL